MGVMVWGETFRIFSSDCSGKSKPCTSSALPGSIEGRYTALKPHYDPVIRAPGALVVQFRCKNLQFAMYNHCSTCNTSVCTINTLFKLIVVGCCKLHKTD